MWLKYNTKYSVNENGEVKNIKTERILKPWRRGKYLAVNIEGRSKIYIHKMVAEVFLVRTLDTYTEVDHIDRNRYNNTATNLRYVSKQENNRNKSIEFTKRKMSSLTSNEHHIRQVREIFIFQISKHNLSHYKSFKTLEEAIKYRDEFFENNKV